MIIFYVVFLNINIIQLFLVFLRVRASMLTTYPHPQEDKEQLNDIDIEKDDVENNRFN